MARLDPWTATDVGAVRLLEAALHGLGQGQEALADRVDLEWSELLLEVELGGRELAQVEPEEILLELERAPTVVHHEVITLPLEEGVGMPEAPERLGAEENPLVRDELHLPGIVRIALLWGYLDQRLVVLDDGQFAPVAVAIGI